MNSWIHELSIQITINKQYYMLVVCALYITNKHIDWNIMLSSDDNEINVINIGAPTIRFNKNHLQSTYTKSRFIALNQNSCKWAN